MNRDGQLDVWLAEEIPPDLLLTPLPDAAATEVIELLKQEADRHWHIDPQHSLVLAERITAIGRSRNDNRQVALGLMARGDALRFLGHTGEAWDALNEAGNLFESAGDQVGWARTRIGCLGLGIKLDRVAEAKAGAEVARNIFIAHGENEKLLRLYLQMGIVDNYLGDHNHALGLFRTALELADLLSDTGLKYFGQLYVNIGFGYDALGDFRQALDYYERARPYMLAANETGNIALLDINIAYIARAQGHYRQALKILHQVLEQISDQFPEEAMWAECDMVECYLQLNRYKEARDLAQKVVNEYRIKNTYELARTLLHLATAEAQLSNFTSAQTALAEAKHIFDSQGAMQWVVTTHLWGGKIALKQGNALIAYQEAMEAAACYESSGQQLSLANACLLQGQALFALGNVEEAFRASTRALQISQYDAVPSLRYSAHLLLGQIREGQGQSNRAAQHYQAASATVERVQRGLSITLRPGFLEDKGDALRSLIALYIRAGQPGKAFEALERSKSQVLLGYLANQEDLHWVQDNDRTQSLISQLSRLRDEHHWYYRLAHEPPGSSDHSSSLSLEQARVEVAIREREMRSITEQIYLQNEKGQQSYPTPALSLSDIRSNLTSGVLLVEFYSDGAQMWAFLLDERQIKVRHLPITQDKLNQLLLQLQSNVTAALKFDGRSPTADSLTLLAQRILQRLYALLIEPLELGKRDFQRLVIVPYGGLHYLPFHLLFDGSQYLIEQYEVVILPAAGLITRPTLRRRPGALVLANSWDGRLPYTLQEAQMVKDMFDGVLHVENMARRASLQAAPSQILHIAAHGEHRLDQPDLSYLELADGQLYTDDLLQENLSYELVTLSGCETGRANIAAGDELIGLGRGFLYAGAGALMVSLWPVMDDTTMQFMHGMYRTLRAGTSKAVALREAQLKILSTHRQLHPAFWGAFQLIGDACPLSTWAD